MQIKCEKSANFFKFVLLYEAFIGGVSSAHGEKNRFFLAILIKIRCKLGVLGHCTA